MFYFTLNGLKSVPTIYPVPTELLQNRAIGSKHFVELDFSPVYDANQDQKEP